MAAKKTGKAPAPTKFEFALMIGIDPDGPEGFNRVVALVDMKAGTRVDPGPLGRITACGRFDDLAEVLARYLSLGQMSESDRSAIKRSGRRVHVPGGGE